MTESTDLTVEAALELFRQLGPLTEDDLYDLLDERGFAPDIVEAVVSGDYAAVTDLTGQRMMIVDAIAPQVRLTHRLSAAEIAADMLANDSDLAALTVPFIDSPVAVSIFDREIFERRDAIELADRLDAVIVLPRGTLAGRHPGDLVAVTATPSSDPAAAMVDPEVRETIDPDGFAEGLFPIDISIEPIAEPADTDLSEFFEQAVPDGDSGVLSDLIWTLIVDHGKFREPAAPISEQVDRAGFEVYGDQVARRGFDFQAEHRRNLESLLAEEYQLPAHAVAALARLSAIAAADHADHVSLVQQELAADPTAFDAFNQPRVLGAALGMMWSRTSLGILDADGVYADFRSASHAVARYAPAAAALTARYLEAMAAVAGEQLDDAELLLYDIIRLAPDWWPAARGLASFATIRGDYAKARSLLIQYPQFADDPLLDTLTELDTSDQPELGRNEPCWCGSGRKYKVCHRGRPQLTPAQQNRALIAKTIEYLSLSPDVHRVGPLIQLRMAFASPRLADELADDPLVDDVLLIEGGILEKLLHVAGDLLGPEDHQIAGEWLRRGRSVFEVEQVSPGQGVSLRDIRTGDRSDVTERAASQALSVGTFICTRVVPEGDQFVMYGGVELVAPAERVELMELLDAGAEPHQLVQFLSRRFAGPQLVSSSGKPLVFYSACFSLSDPGSIRRKLSRRYGKGEDDQWVWSEGPSVNGELNLNDDHGPDTLTISAMDESRYDELVDSVYRMDPEAVLLHEDQQDAADLFDEYGPDFDPDDLDDDFAPGPAQLEGMSPEVIDMVSRFMRDKEEDWVNLSVPALRGLTPRQAVADPTTRDEVIRLLATFPQDDSPGMMSVHRLRKLLGLS